MSDMIWVWDITCGDQRLICDDRVEAAVTLMDLLEQENETVLEVEKRQMSRAEFEALEEAE